MGSHKVPQQQHKPFARTSYYYGIPVRSAFILAVCVALGCLVWRVYGEGDNKIEIGTQFQSNILNKNYDDRRVNANEELTNEIQYADEPVENVYADADAFDGKAEPTEDYKDVEPYEFTGEEYSSEESTSSADEEIGLDFYQDEGYQQVGQLPNENGNAGEAVEGEATKMPETEEKSEPQDGIIRPETEATLYDEAKANREDISGLYYPNFYPEDLNEKKEKATQKPDDYVGYYAEYGNTEANNNNNNNNVVEAKESQEAAEDDDGNDVIFVADQGDAEIARAFPDLVGVKSDSKSESDDTPVEDYFPGYDYYRYGYDDSKDTPKKDTQKDASTSTIAATTQPEEKTQNQNSDVQADVEGGIGMEDIYGVFVDPLQSALRFKERMDALYTSQIEALNYRNYIFDGSQFVAQLRQSLLEELTRFRDGWDKLSSLPLVESPPSVEVAEGAEEITLDVALPGTLRKFIRLELQNQQLILSGTRERRSDSDTYSVVTFFHSFPVPRGVRSDDIRAQFDDDTQIIHVRIRKPSASRPDPTHITIE